MEFEFAGQLNVWIAITVVKPTVNIIYFNSHVLIATDAKCCD